MTPDIGQFALGVSWIATAVGVGLWIWAMFERTPVRKLRFSDCGTVLIFSSILLRLVEQRQPMTVIHWALALLSPLFVAAALWRLARTACPDESRGGPK
jgi:hypothetical protein